MKLTLEFFRSSSGKLACKQEWAGLNLAEVTYLSSSAINQSLDSFCSFIDEYIIVDNKDKRYLKIKSDSFKYFVGPKFEGFIGSYNSLSLTMPFSNDSEFFMGNQCILLPHTADFKTDFYDCVEVEIINKTDLQYFGSLKQGKVDKEQLELFYCYLCPRQENTFIGKSGDTTIQIVQSKDASLAINAQDLFNETDRFHQYYLNELGGHKQKELDIVHILPDPNFQELNDGKTFATGENIRGAILIYLPNNPDYIEWLSGHKDYLEEVKYGLIHEIGHFYSSKGGDPQKTIITHDSTCPERDYWIVGENLNGYFTSIIAYNLGVISTEQTFNHLVEQQIKVYEKRKGYAGCLYFCFVDQYLKEENSSLWDVYKRMLSKQRQKQFLYKNISYFISSCADFCGPSTLDKIKELFELTPNQLIERYRNRNY